MPCVQTFKRSNVVLGEGILVPIDGRQWKKQWRKQFKRWIGEASISAE